MQYNYIVLEKHCVRMRTEKVKEMVEKILYNVGFQSFTNRFLRIDNAACTFAEKYHSGPKPPRILL